MSADLVIRGGTVMDGSGEPGVRADVAVTGGLIEAIGTGLDGTVELDASECVVAPGFIDIHTHFDAQVFWDPALKPSSYHGVTTVVAGNCGFSIAPCRPEHHEVIVRTWRTWRAWTPTPSPQGSPGSSRPSLTISTWSAEEARHSTSPPTSGIPRCGSMSWGTLPTSVPATYEEIERMCQLVDEAMNVGAAGLSTSFSFAHRGVDGKPVPSRFAEMDEVEALFTTVGKAGKGVVLATPGWQCEYPDVFMWQERIGRPFTCPLFALASGKHREVVLPARRGPRPWGQRVAAGHASSAHHAVHPF